MPIILAVPLKEIDGITLESIMRVDKNTGQIYDNFGDWLRNEGHIIWIISLVFAYAVYLTTTEEM